MIQAPSPRGPTETVPALPLSTELQNIRDAHTYYNKEKKAKILPLKKGKDSSTSSPPQRLGADRVGAVEQL